MNALSLVSIGSLHKDKQVLRKAVEEYTLALNILAHVLVKPETLYDDNILAAIIVLKLCEFYDEIKQEGQGWIEHQNGMQQLLAARGPKSLKGEFSSMLFASAKQSSLARSMLVRKKNFYDSPVWMELDPSSPEYDVGMQLPALLESHDNLNLSLPSALWDIDILLHDSMRLENDLRQYLEANLSSSAASSGEPFIEEDIECFAQFTKLVPDSILTKAYRFQSFTIAFFYTSYWLRMHFLRTTMKSLYTQRAHVAKMPAQRCHGGEHPVRDEELLEYIMNLCRSIPFFIDPENGSIGHICCFFPIVASAKYFNLHGQYEWLKWIHHVRSRIFNRGLSMPMIEGTEVPAVGLTERQNT